MYVPGLPYWWLAVGPVVVVTGEPSPQFQVYWVNASPAGSLADAARVSESPAYVVGSNGLKDMPLILGEPVAGARIVAVVCWTVKKSPPS